MNTRVRIVAALGVSVMCLPVAACGSSKTAASAATSSASSSPVASPSSTSTGAASDIPDAVVSGIKTRLYAQDGTFATATTDPLIETAAQVRSVSNGQEKSADRLDGAGRQSLKTSRGAAGIRVVFHFPDEATALADLTALTGPDQANASATTYTVPGVPNSSGSEDTDGAGGGDRNVTFVVGKYEYRLGFAIANGAGPTRDELISLTQAWYAAVKPLS